MYLGILRCTLDTAERRAVRNHSQGARMAGLEATIPIQIVIWYRHSGIQIKTAVRTD